MAHPNTTTPAPAPALNSTDDGSGRGACSLFQVLHVLDAVNVYYVPVIIAAGCALNVITCVTLRRTKLKRHAVSHFLAAKCAADTVFLGCLGCMWATQMGFTAIQTDATCPYLWLASQLSHFLSIWLVVVMCCERHLLVSERGLCCGLRCCCGDRKETTDAATTPETPRPRCTVLKGQMVIVGLVIVGVVVYVNISHTVGALHLANTSMCAPLPMFLNTSRILYKVDILVNVVVPYVLVLVLTVATWRGVARLTALRRGTVTAHRGLAHLRTCPKAELQQTRMVAVYALVFVLLTFPTQSMRVLHDARDSLSVHSRLGLREYLWQYCMQMIFRTSFAVNFLVVLAAHRTFRRALRQLLRACFYRLKAAIGRRRRRRGQLTMQALQFTVEFSSTLVRLKETNLG